MPQLLGRQLHPDDVPEVSNLSAGELILGTLGSFAGGYLMTIPWILISYYTGFFVGWLGYLIGLGAIYGFVFGAQKIHGFALPIVIIVILTAVPLAEFTGITMAFIENGFIPDPLNVLGFALSEDYVGSFIFSLVVGYIIAIAGTWSLMQSLRSQNS